MVYDLLFLAVALVFHFIRIQIFNLFFKLSLVFGGEFFCCFSYRKYQGYIILLLSFVFRISCFKSFLMVSKLFNRSVFFRFYTFFFFHFFYTKSHNLKWHVFKNS